MITYTQPFTFCWLVCNDLATRKWKIRKEGRQVVILSTPDSSQGTGSKPTIALLEMCQQHARKHKLPFAYNADACARPVAESDDDKDEPPPMPAGYHTQGTNGTFTWKRATAFHDESIDSLYEEIFRAMRRP